MTSRGIKKYFLSHTIRPTHITAIRSLPLTYQTNTSAKPVLNFEIHFLPNISYSKYFIQQTPAMQYRKMHRNIFSKFDSIVCQTCPPSFKFLYFIFRFQYLHKYVLCNTFILYSLWGHPLTKMTNMPYLLNNIQ